MEDEPAEERQVLVDGHLETSDVPPRGRHDDARAAGGACKLVGLIDVQDDARGVVNEAREVEERGDDATGAEGGTADVVVKAEPFEKSSCGERGESIEATRT